MILNFIKFKKICLSKYFFPDKVENKLNFEYVIC